MAVRKLEIRETEFWIGWGSALDGMEAALKTLLAINDYDRSTKPSDVILDVENVVKEMRELEPSLELQE